MGDDAISIEIKEGNKKNLWIHISNPCKLFLHDSNVDLEARKRNSSLYLIDQYVPMLPKDILEKANLAGKTEKDTRRKKQKKKIKKSESRKLIKKKPKNAKG